MSTGGESTVEQPDTVTWRRPQYERALAVVMVAVLAGVWIILLATNDIGSGWQDVVLPVVAIPIGLLQVVRSWRTRLTLTPQTVIVCNLFRIYDVHIAEIVGARAGTSGIWLILRDGRTLRAAAVSKSQTDVDRGTYTEADAIAARITAVAGTTGLPVLEPVTPVPLPSGYFIAMAVVGLAMLIGGWVLIGLAGRSGLLRGLGGLLDLSGFGFILLGLMELQRRSIKSGKGG